MGTDLLYAIVAAAGPRIKVLGDILDYDYFWLSDEEVRVDPVLLQKYLDQLGEAK